MSRSHSTTVRQQPLIATLSPIANSAANGTAMLSREPPTPSGLAVRTLPIHSTKPVNILLSYTRREMGSCPLEWWVIRSQTALAEKNTAYDQKASTSVSSRNKMLAMSSGRSMTKGCDFFRIICLVKCGYVTLLTIKIATKIAPPVAQASSTLSVSISLTVGQRLSGSVPLTSDNDAMQPAAAGDGSPLNFFDPSTDSTLNRASRKIVHIMYSVATPASTICKSG